MGFKTPTQDAVIENGFRDDPVLSPASRDITTLAFDDATRTFSISIDAPYTEYIIYAENQRWAINATKTLQIPDTEGLYVIYFDGTATLQYSTSLTTTIIANECLVASLYWDATNKKALLLGDERHGRSMDSRTHAMNHLTVGSRYQTGLALSGFSADGTGNDAADAQFSVGSGIIWDEDIQLTITDDSPQALSPAEIPIFYKSGATGVWRRVDATVYPITTTGTGRAAWNEWTGATWQLTEVTNNQFVLYHYYATNVLANPIIGVVGQADHNTLTAARDAAATEIATLNTAGLGTLTQEFLPIGTVIWQTNDGYANAVKSRVRTVSTGVNYIDWRTQLLGREGVGGVTDHGLLSGLLDDDHTQYALLAGRAGGQTFKGDTAASGTLTLESTANATKGKIIFNTDVAGTVGIGTTAPDTHIELRKASLAYWNVGSNLWNGIAAGVPPPQALTITNSQNSGYDPVAIWRMATSTGTLKISAAIGTVGTDAWNDASIGTQTVRMYFNVRDSAGAIQERLSILSNGATGIGTQTPAARLAINGGLHVGGDSDPGDNNLLVDGTATITGAFGCNGAAAQTAYASGGALAAYATGAFGLDSDANMQALYNLVVAMRAALVANGIMS